MDMDLNTALLFGLGWVPLLTMGLVMYCCEKRRKEAAKSKPQSHLASQSLFKADQTQVVTTKEADLKNGYAVGC